MNDVMDWFQLTPSALTPLSGLIVAAAGLFYLLTLHDKTRSTRLLLVYLTCMANALFVGFLLRSVLAPWQTLLLPLRLLLIQAALTVLLEFSCTFLETAEPRPINKLVLWTRWLTGGIGLIILVAMTARVPPPPIGMLLIGLYSVGLAIMPPLIFLRRSIRASQLALAHRSSHLSLLGKPHGRIARGLQAFGLATTAHFLLLISHLLVHFRVLSPPAHDMLFLLIASAYLFSFVVLYLSYAPEHSTLQVKFIGLSLVFVLGVLQAVALLWYTPQRLTRAAGIRPLDHSSLHFTPNRQGGYDVRRGGARAPSVTTPDTAISVADGATVDLGFDFPFYGRTWRSVRILSHGYLAFGSPQSGDRTRSSAFVGRMKALHLYRGSPKIIPLYTASRLTISSHLKHEQTPDRAIFTWFEAPWRRTIQVVLHVNGGIGFTYGKMGMPLTAGLIGLSPGGTEPPVRSLHPLDTESLAGPADAALLNHLTLRYRHYVHSQVSRLALLTIGAALCVVFLFPLCYRLFLTQPMAQLIQGLQRVDHGDFDTELAVYTRDEFGILAQHFNQMIASLQHHEQKRQQYAWELEQEVQYRTQELAEQNILLEQQTHQLRELDQTKSRFFANVSHEFRTPLTLMMGPLEDLADGRYGVMDPAIQEQISQVGQHTQRILHLINQMLDIAKLQDHQLTLQMCPGDLSAFVRHMGQAFVPIAERHRLTFNMVTPAEPAWVDFDGSQLEKVFFNLLSNAFKFTPEGGTIAITLELAASCVTVTISDNGPGISADHLPYVFQRFYQVRDALHPSHPGTGIGLSLAKELVTLHQGHIDVESTPGQGTTFTVQLPQSQSQTQADQMKPEAATALDLAYVRTLLASTARAREVETAAMDEATVTATMDEDATRILIADDHAEIRAYMRLHLAAHYRVFEAENGIKALDLARTELPDLVVSDVMMPEMDGMALCRHLKADPRLARIIHKSCAKGLESPF